MQDKIVEEREAAEVEKEEPNWLLQPWVPPDAKPRIAEIAEAREITSEFLQTLELELAEFQKSATAPTEVDLDCGRLVKCGSFSGNCPNLRECGGYG